MTDRARARSPANTMALHRLMTSQKTDTISNQHAHMLWFGISNGVTTAKKMTLPYRVSALRIFSSTMESFVVLLAVFFGNYER